jgi:VanZ family protein
MIPSRPFRAIAWLLFCVAAAGVLYYTLRPGPSGTAFMWRDKLQHMSAYGTLALLATLGARSQGQALLFATLLAAAGYALEIVQPYVGRSYDLLDEAANIAGCLVGFALARLLIRTWYASRTA